MQQFAVEILADFPLFDNHAPVVDHAARQLEHFLIIGIRCIDRDVGVGPHSQVAFVRQPQHLRRGGPRNDGDFVECVFPSQIAQHAVFSDGRMYTFQHFFAARPVHEQGDDFRIGQKRAAVRMIGAHRDPPRVIDEQIPFEPNGPLQRVDAAFVFVRDWDDAAACFQFCIAREPLASVDFVQKVSQRPVAGHRRRFTEQHLPHVGREIGVGVEVVRESGHLGAKSALIIRIATVTVELDMRQMGSQPRERLHRAQSRLPVAR